MARKFLTALDLVQNELQNAKVQNLAGAPSSPVKGQLYMNTTDNTMYWWDGAVWQSAKGGSMAFGAVVPEATFGGTSADGVAATAARSDHKHANPLHDNAAHSTIPHNALAAPTADVPWGGFKITNLGTPTVSTDAADKTYVDGLVFGVSWKEPVRAGTTANITLSGLQTVDGVSLAAGNRVLVKNQTNPAENGMYDAASGAWTRCIDASTEASILNASVFVQEGTTLADTAWVCTANSPITIGTTAITWVQFAGSGMINAGSGLTQSGNTLNVGAGTGIAVAADTVSFDQTYGDGRYALVASGAKRFAQDVGGATSQVVTHNLATLDTVIHVYRKASPFDQVECDVEHTSTNTITLRFTVAPAAAEYRVVVLA